MSSCGDRHDSRASGRECPPRIVGEVVRRDGVRHCERVVGAHPERSRELPGRSTDTHPPNPLLVYAARMVDYLRMMLRDRVGSERGTSAVEYGLLVAGVCLACVMGFEAFAFTLRTLFSNSHSNIEQQP